MGVMERTRGFGKCHCWFHETILTKFLTVIIICSVDLSETAQHNFTLLLHITVSHLIKHSHFMQFVAVP